MGKFIIYKFTIFSSTSEMTEPTNLAWYGIGGANLLHLNFTHMGMLLV